ncbi:M20/M25/M40 family metallo-hydrolase [Abyssisolibacter fermentans]|uniref:M20/M25/M40 family metallo-hydrolase n=1 Tax=Abyssisolibacter fermentans TaxID=1766203 RepID=UPI00082BE6CD|nr:M20/M25/M40 family metallo-hydrolase [Abyssisolibacter fermentans]
MKNDIYNIFKELVAIKSDTGTVLEKDVENYIYTYIHNIDYFKQNPSYCGKFKLSVDEDYFDRAVIWGLVKGDGEDTVILINHHDVVDSLDYGVLAKYAYDIEEIKEKLKDIDISREVRDDLESDDWIFGRGTCDMKAGGAIQLDLLKEYSKLKDFKGNLLYISVPDEENLSLGMREGIKLLIKLKNEFNLNYSLLINSEPHQRQKNDTGILYEGSVGKIMPQIYVRGRKTHIGDIYQGLNPSLILSEIVKKVEVNTDFSDIEGDEITPPPSWIYFRDKKERYDVSIPQTAGGYFSILTLNRTPKDILEQLEKVCEDAFEESIKHLQNSYKKYNELTNKENESLNWKINVKTFEEIYEEAKQNHREDFLSAYDEKVKKLEIKLRKNDINLPECGFVLIQKTLEYIDDLSPIVVISFAPPYYPHVDNIKLNNITDKVSDLSEVINEFAIKNWEEKYIKKNYFMGISDMSYTGLLDSSKTIPYIAPNMPLWAKFYTIPLEELKQLNIPVINIGPWGKDLHKFTERVYKKDLLERTPILIKLAVDYVLNL